MVKALLLGLLLFAALARAAPPTKPPPEGEEDPAARSERSANLSHVTGTARKIKMFIKHRHLQLLPGGTVNGTTDDNSPYSESNHFSTTNTHSQKLPKYQKEKFICRSQKLN